MGSIFANYNSVAYLKNLFEKGIECDILKASFSCLAYHIELYILGRINVSLKCSRLPVFIAVIDLQQYLTEQVICFNFQSVYTGVMITLFDWMSLDRLKKIPGIHVYGDPLMSVVGFGPAEGFKYNIFTFSDMIAKRGWNLNPLQFPSRLVFLFCL